MYDGYRRRLDKLAELTGPSVPTALFSKQPAMLLFFVSDDTVEKKGFKIEYNAGGYQRH